MQTYSIIYLCKETEVLHIHPIFGICIAKFVYSLPLKFMEEGKINYYNPREQISRTKVCWRTAGCQ
jgi:hypothetical protein